MSTPHRTRLVNPRLGTYFGIFASAFAGLFLTVLILEQLSAPVEHLRLAVLIGPLLLFMAIAIASYTANIGEFFAAGRRVPAVFNGLIFAISAIGGTGLIAFTGLFFINGFDTWFVLIGISSGFLVMGIAISPYLRKYGAYTVPSYLARRFESRAIRIVAASVFALPLVLLLAAELGMAVYVATLLTGYPSVGLAALLAVVVFVTMVFGGMRAVGWVSTAQAIAAVIAILVLAGMIGVTLTNLPLAQLSYGPVLRHIGRLEDSQQIVTQARAVFAFDLAGRELVPLARRLATPFGSVGSGSFIAGVLCMMMGIAGAPWLLPRCATTLGVYEARKSLGWAILFAGVIVLTLSAVAVFMRGIVMSDLVGRGEGQFPAWFAQLRDLGLAGTAGPGRELPLHAFMFARDGVFYAAPVALGFPSAVLHLVLAGAIAAALAAASATAFSLASILSEDVFGGLKWEPVEDNFRALTARVMCAVVVIFALVFYFLVNADPLELFLSALALSASSAFPVIVLSIWWKRLSVAGAASAMLVGCGLTITFMLVDAGNVVAVPVPVAAVAASFTAVVVAIGVSLMSPKPQRAALEAAREMRIPGGETVYDREMRQLRFSQRSRE